VGISISLQRYWKKFLQAEPNAESATVFGRRSRRRRHTSLFGGAFAFSVIVRLERPREINARQVYR
jgi:hypothetical protein